MSSRPERSLGCSGVSWGIRLIYDLSQIDHPVGYRPVESDDTARAAEAIANLIEPGSAATAITWCSEVVLTRPARHQTGARIGDLISYQNDGKDSTAIASKVENA